MSILPKWLLQMSHPAPAARALGLLHPDTEQSKNLDVIVLTPQKRKFYYREFDAEAVGGAPLESLGHAEVVLRGRQDSGSHRAQNTQKVIDESGI